MDKLTGGCSIAPDDYLEEGFRTIPKGAVNDSGNADLSVCKFVSYAFYEKNASNVVSTNELITSLRDLVPSAPNMGRIVRINGGIDHFLMPQGVYKIEFKDNISDDFVIAYSNSNKYRKTICSEKNGSTQVHIRNGEFLNIAISLPKHSEQMQIGSIFKSLDNLITLQQRESFKQFSYKEVGIVLNQVKETDLFYEYYSQWITVYKEGAIRKVTLNKYFMSLSWIKKLIPDLQICELTRIAYQQLINDYSLNHERQTTMDFHHQLKGAILDAVDEGLIDRDPTRKVIIKGKTPSDKKVKFLNQFELHTVGL